MAVVISEPEDKEYKYRYTIRIESVIENVNAKYKLSDNNILSNDNIYNENTENTYKGIKLILDVKLKNQKYIPKFGDKIILNGNVQIPNTSRNYKGFDYRQYLKTKKIYGIIGVEHINKIGEEMCLYKEF